MRAIACAALLLTAMLLLPAPAAAQLRSVELYAPRPFGWVIGDTIDLTVDIALDAPFRLDPASLPTPRPLDYWLDLREVRLKERGIEAGMQHYTLDLTYQTFYAPLEPKRLDIPALHLAAVDGGRRVEVAVPPWSFLMSPLREIVTTTQGATMALRPDVQPRPIPTSDTLRGLLVTLGCGLLAAGILARQMGWGPFDRRRDRPFARAARTVRSELSSSASSYTSPYSAPAYRTALLALHRAFDAKAGKGVFAEDLPGFFAAHPAFAAVEAEVRRLFAASRRLFFSEDPSAAARDLPPAELVALARRLRAVERGSL